MAPSPAPGPSGGERTPPIRARHHFTGTPVAVTIHTYSLAVERVGAPPHRSPLTFPHKRVYALSTVRISDGADDGRSLGPHEHSRLFGPDGNSGWRLVRISDDRPAGPLDHLVLSIRPDQLARLEARLRAIRPDAAPAPTSGYSPIDPAWRPLASRRD